MLYRFRTVTNRSTIAKKKLVTLFSIAPFPDVLLQRQQKQQWKQGATKLFTLLVCLFEKLGTVGGKHTHMHTHIDTHTHTQWWVKKISLLEKRVLLACLLPSYKLLPTVFVPVRSTLVPVFPLFLFLFFLPLFVTIPLPFDTESKRFCIASYAAVAAKYRCRGRARGRMVYYYYYYYFRVEKIILYYPRIGLVRKQSKAQQNVKQSKAKQSKAKNDFG